MEFPFYCKYYAFLSLFSIWSSVHSQQDCVCPPVGEPCECTPATAEPTGEAHANNVITWMSFPLDLQFTVNHPPAGIQNQEYLYVCRVLQNNGHYISGKLRIGESTRCLVANNGGATQHENFQRLLHPKHTISWIPIPTDTSVPKGAIVSGTSDSGKTQHVCRGFVKVDGRVDVVPGKYASYKRTCYVVLNGAQFAVKAGDILVINALGEAMGVTQANDEHLFRCNDGKAPLMHRWFN